MVDGEFLVDYLLQVLAYVAEPEVQALQGLQLRCYARGEGADGYVADVTEEVLHAYFFGFFGFDYGGGVHECFCGGGAVLSFASAVLAGDEGGREGSKGRHTSLISSTAKYASVGTPTSFGCTSIMTSNGLGV